MADTLSSTIKASIDWTFIEALDLSINNVISGSLPFSASLADGTSASQADKVWFDERSVNSAANDDLDLTALTYSLYGSTVTISFARVSAILLYNTATATGEELRIDTSVANGFNLITGGASGKIEVGPSSPLIICNIVDGWAVANGSTDVLRITNVGAAAITYRIAIIGRSA